MTLIILCMGHRALSKAYAGVLRVMCTQLHELPGQVLAIEQGGYICCLKTPYL